MKNEPIQTLTRQLTYGEKLVRVNFNPAGSSPVEDCKVKFAAIIDTLNDLRGTVTEAETVRSLSLAITEAEIACMCAVKALTSEEFFKK